MEQMCADIAGARWEEEYIEERFEWLIDAGASCLVRDNLGRRVSDTVRGKTPLFAGIIARAVADDNWGRRKGLVFLRYVLSPEPRQGVCKALRAQTSVDEGDTLVLGAATMGIVRVFRNVVSYL